MLSPVPPGLLGEAGPVADPQKLPEALSRPLYPLRSRCKPVGKPEMLLSFRVTLLLAPVLKLPIRTPYLVPPAKRLLVMLMLVSLPNRPMPTLVPPSVGVVVLVMVLPVMLEDTVEYR